MFSAINNDLKFEYNKISCNSPNTNILLTFKVENKVFLRYLTNNVSSYTNHKQNFQSFGYCDNCKTLQWCGFFGSFPSIVASLPQYII